MKSIVSAILKNLYIAGIVYAVFSLVLFPKWTVDDAFITYRYAFNLAEHGSLTWNPAEDPIEGYTGIALPTIIALLIKLSVSPVAAGKIIGILFYFLGVWWLYRILQKLFIRMEVISAVLVLYLTCPLLISIAWCGLETMVYIALLLACTNQLLTVVMDKDSSIKNEAGLYLLLLISSLTRPEAAVLAFIAICALVALRVKFDRNRLAGTLKRAALFFFVPGIIYFLWRWNLYGYFLPNTFYAKSGHQFLVKNSIVSFAFFALLYCFIPVLAAGIMNIIDFKNIKSRLWTGWNSIEKTKLIYIGFSLTLFSAVIILRYFSSILKMNFESRFFAPYYPLFLIFLAFFFNSGAKTFVFARSGKSIAVKLTTAALALFAIVQLTVNINRLQQFSFNRWGYDKLVNEVLIPIGLELKNIVPENEYIAVIYDAGAIPFYSQRKTIDFSRLNNEYLSHHRPSPEELTDYFFGYNIAAVVISSNSSEKLTNIWYYGSEADIITSDPRFENYTLYGKYRADVPPDNPTAEYYEFVYLRSDLAARPK